MSEDNGGRHRADDHDTRLTFPLYVSVATVLEAYGFRLPEDPADRDHAHRLAAEYLSHVVRAYEGRDRSDATVYVWLGPPPETGMEQYNPGNVPLDVAFAHGSFDVIIETPDDLNRAIDWLRGRT